MGQLTVIETVREESAWQLTRFQIRDYSRPLEPLGLKGSSEVGGQAGELAAKSSNTLRPHGVPLHCCQQLSHLPDKSSICFHLVGHGRASLGIVRKLFNVSGLGSRTIWLFSNGSSISFRLARWRMSEQMRSAVAPRAQTALATRRSTLKLSADDQLQGKARRLTLRV